jgi:hypothetical protein
MKPTDCFLFLPSLLLLWLPATGQITEKAQAEQEDTYFREAFLRYDNYIYKDSIRSVILHREGWEISPALIMFNTDEKLSLSFDDLDPFPRNYRYTVVHCDAWWQPSDLRPMEYIEGFQEDDITEYRYSRNTLLPYLHYELVFPTDYLRITKPGNYLLKVYDDKPDNLCLTWRFMVIEPLVDIQASAHQAVDLDLRSTGQEVDFTLSAANLRLTNPYTEIKVVITQNDRRDNAIRDLKPRMVRGSELDYTYDKENTFEGGNEFRWFDIKSVHYQSDRIARTSDKGVTYDTWLSGDSRRTFEQYLFEEDMNGKRYIKTDDGTDSDTEAEYVNVHFFLSYSPVLIHGNVYVMGELTGWQLDGRSQMRYNFRDKGYELTLLLKQGYYNYCYAFLPDGKSKAETGFIEGSHFETENDYTIYVYHRAPGTLYDKLVGLKQLNSRGK